MVAIQDVWKPGVEFVAGGDRRILLLSMREIADLVGYCALYEFEDVIADVTGADMAKPVNLGRMDFSRRVYELARPHRLAWYGRLHQAAARGLPTHAKLRLVPAGVQPSA